MSELVPLFSVAFRHDHLSHCQISKVHDVRTVRSGGTGMQLHPWKNSRGAAQFPPPGGPYESAPSEKKENKFDPCVKHFLLVKGIGK